VSKYQHIFFDLDRTLWDFDTNSRHALTDIYHEFQLQGMGIESPEIFVEVYQAINEALWARYRKGQLNKRLLRSRRFFDTLVHFGIEDEYLGEKLGEAYIDISPYKTAVSPNCMEVLDYLAGKYQMHILTNGFEEVQHIKLKHSGLRRYFTKVITSERAGARKPDPTVFSFAFALTKGSNGDSIMIGDDLNTDILGARNVMMDHVYYNPNQLSHGEELFHEITDLMELKHLL
jgi:putative hydrolase of the HAD superfamily